MDETAELLHRWTIQVLKHSFIVPEAEAGSSLQKQKLLPNHMGSSLE